MIVKTIPTGIYATNCYLVINEATMDTIVIDPGDDQEKLIAIIEKNGLKVKSIFLTHGHIDHVGAVKALSARYNLMTYINREDLDLMDKNTYIYGNINGVPITHIRDQEVINIGGFEVKCIETPGHSPGGMSFLIEDVIFSGDTLFQSSIGRTDFEGGDYDTLIKSIVEKLLILEDNLIVYPGHGPSTTIEKERRTNPFIN